MGLLTQPFIQTLRRRIVDLLSCMLFNLPALPRGLRRLQEIFLTIFAVFSTRDLRI